MFQKHNFVACCSNRYDSYMMHTYPTDIFLNLVWFRDCIQWIVT